jgi:hypothetical protein
MKNIRATLALAGLMAISSSHAATLAENFSTNPSQDGWQIFGDTNLFLWDSTNQVLDVTWDSSQPNSYFYHPLGTILATSDNFSIEFDLQLSQAASTGPNGYQLAVGLLNFADATNTNFSRPVGTTPNLFEFDYSPPYPIYGPSIAGTLSDMADNYGYPDFYFIYDNLSMENGVTYHIILTHVAGEQTLSGEVLTNGQIYTTMPDFYPTPLADFRLDTVSISSYSDADDIFGDSIFAQGTVANLIITLPPPPVQNLTGVFSNGAWQAQFCSQSNWLYTLERTANFQCWTNVSPATPGNGTNLFLQDANPPADKAFYRVSACRPCM